MIGALAARNNLRVKNARQPNLILILLGSCNYSMVYDTQ